jgi:hypothetical protein
MDTTEKMVDMVMEKIVTVTAMKKQIMQKQNLIINILY